MSEPGFIYAIAECGTDHVKVGWTSVLVEARRQALQVGNPRILKVVAFCQGSRGDERQLHRDFNAYRVLNRLEWFSLDHEGLKRLCLAILDRGGVVVK